MSNFELGRLFGNYFASVLMSFGITRLIHRLLRSSTKLEIRALIGFGVICLIGYAMSDNERRILNWGWIWLASGIPILIWDLVALPKREAEARKKLDSGSSEPGFPPH